MPAPTGSAWRDRFSAMLGHALPQACTLCAAPAGIDLVCDDCHRSLARIDGPCPRCALPLAAGAGARCLNCLASDYTFDATDAAFAYGFPLDRLVQAYKYNGNLSLAGWFADSMVAHRAGLGGRPGPVAADAIVPMPLAQRRQRERGFNHALEIARGLSRRTGIALMPRAVERTRETAAQATLPWSERAFNVHGAFAATMRFDGLAVIVVDDVMTTGASLEAMARTLKAAGARHVANWVVARTLPPRDEAS